ncbi:bifunctional hydroxymethylpyrimidine kinase/phosphomethylpyrimidine kinase [Shewanella sp. AS16]|uniref:bifunctional hydroxymethylpyrimidine kinase/phosphomethylpyrimidine kinase n=1 Tax=Shewanella sp. AS16 TaxID=2907625 RepID=UPI001F1C4B04|nr:bifunctional hydroxymethylpyrimidine kinase/phosphomethylpyrimidine kinase [Shewanella sp. AS16]MCE9687408.1 bifunctional hydroxymethylpyrimidine kinase/phosphomethylpyrimidine kinase [Shewanella sp. AS16]
MASKAPAPMPAGSRPIVWTIAGSDSGGGAGIQADLATIQDLGCHGCSIISQITAQSSVAVSLVESVSDAMLLAQLDTLLADMPPRAIKIGLLGPGQVSLLAHWLATRLADYQARSHTSVAVILDPVMTASCGDPLGTRAPADGAKFEPFAGLLSLITPNYAELALLDGSQVEDFAGFEAAAARLAQRLQTRVLAKGGDVAGRWLAQESCDILILDEVAGSSPLHQHCRFSLTSPRVATADHHGTGCTLSAAIASALAAGFVLQDAVVLAKAYVNAGLGQGYAPGVGAGVLGRSGWPQRLSDFPRVRYLDRDNPAPMAFPPLQRPIGVYPVVDSLAMLETLLLAGVDTLQLRLKTDTDSGSDPGSDSGSGLGAGTKTCMTPAAGAALEADIVRAIALGRDHQAQLFINDHWQLALKHGAYGVHLGQEDLAGADLSALARAGVALGISSHGYFELLLARQLAPSYIALGHIFPTSTKSMPSAPQGLDKLRAYVRLLEGHFPLVAIGGIDRHNLAAVKATGVDAIALVRAVTQAESPAAAYLALSLAWSEAVCP